jgi:hypothetical protein
VTNKEKWEYFFNKYNIVKQEYNQPEIYPGSKKDMKFVEHMLEHTTNSSNKRCDMTVKSGLDPVNFTYFLKQYFYYKNRYDVKRSLFFKIALFARSQLGIWTPDYKMSGLSNEFYRIQQERWQIHARIGVIFLRIKKSLQIDFSTLKRHSDAYTVVLYKNKVTIASLGSQYGKNIASLDLEKGFYQIVFRFYSDTHELYYPQLIVDGNRIIAAARDPNKQKFYHFVQYWMDKKAHPIYFIQNFHTFYWLKYERTKMPEVILHDFLPVPNPDTKWEYQYLQKGQYVNLVTSKKFLNEYRIYITFLNEMSLPIYGKQVIQENFNSDSIREDGAYHIRFVKRGVHGKEKIPKLEYEINVRGGT